MSKRLNILIIIPELGQGGAERAVSKLSLLLEPYHDIYFLQFNNRANVYYPMAGELLYLNVLPSNNLFFKVVNVFNRIIKTRKIKIRYKIDVSISFLEGANYINVLSKKNEKVIISARGSISQDIEISKFFGWCRKKVLIPTLYKKADKIVALSEGLKFELIEQFGLSQDQVEVIYNSYDIKYIQKRLKESISSYPSSIFTKLTIVTSGRLHPQKSHDQLIKVFSEIKRVSSLNYKLVLFGDGALKHRLIELAESLGLKTYNAWSSEQDLCDDSDIYFMGYVKDPFNYISKCGVFAFPSLYEGLGNSLVEALACEIPIVASDCHSGPREVLAPSSFQNFNLEKAEYARYGVLMPQIKDEKTIKEWRVTLCNIMENESIINRYREIGKERIMDFNNSEIATKWLDVINLIQHTSIDY
ncbi:MAG TPA: glycosyltransferase [Fulvivirga sp.]|nr:glycosyltransferase [Fulvivirga sp.]